MSSAPFDTLNFHVTGTETRENVAENLRRVASEIGFLPDAIVQVDQVHGTHVLIADGEGPAARREQADAIVLTDGKAGGVRIADCIPILVGDMVSGKAAAIHAGWRGIEAGVIGAALSVLGDSRNMRVAAIGPCIGSCCFEVGADVAYRIALAAGDPDVIVRRSGDKAYVDLRLAARAQLRAYGLPAGDVEVVGGCTRCDAATYFSFRRDGKESGRHLAVIRARS